MNKKLIASIPNIVLGVLIAVAPQTFAHACVGHDPATACHYSAMAATGIGAVIALLGAVSLFVNAQIRIGLNIASALNAILLLTVPAALIGVCRGAMMHCRAVMLPTLIVLGVLVIVFALIAVVIDSRTKAQR